MKKGKTVFEINSVPYGSTGRIMFQIAGRVDKEGGKAYTAASFVKKRSIILPDTYYQIGGMIDKFIHIKLAQITGKHGCYSIHATKVLIKRIKEANPDIIHLHNLHEGYINIPLFFDFLKDYNKAVVWTLHDCWAITGHCPHFVYEGCYKWKRGCFQCPKYHEYPVCKKDNSEFQYQLKKEAFCGIKNLVIVTPSEWLNKLLDESYLAEYKKVVINNGIDLNIFHPQKSDFRCKYDIGNKFMILGVAFDWGIKKGLKIFEMLANELDDNYVIVMVGIREGVKKELPSNIIAIECTQNQEELAQIYTSADLLVNPTLEDTFPSVNMEALACGTPVLSYQTGGTPEIVDENCGAIVSYNDYYALKEKIEEIKENKPYSSDTCQKRAKYFDLEISTKKYINLFNDITD